MQVDCKVMIVGAGPHALSVMLRLMCETPHSSVTDDQHQRLYHWRSKRSRKQDRKRGPVQLPQHCTENCCRPGLEGIVINPKHQVAIIDPAGQWMSRWNDQFESYGIEQLRSPATFHPDPYTHLCRIISFSRLRCHLDSLKEYARLHGRENELSECAALFDSAIKTSANVPTRTVFNERERDNFLVPTSRLFRDFCDWLIARNGLNEAVTKGRVVCIDPVVESSVSSTPLYFNVSVEMEPNKLVVVRCEHVVCCIGFMNRPRIPKWVDQVDEASRMIPANSIVHSNQLLSSFKTASPTHLPEHVCDRLKRKQPCHLVIVGGGLTSAHLCMLGYRLGFDRITLLIRSHLVVKFFDASLPWVGQYKNIEFSKFYACADMQERLNIVKGARQGGSVNPDAMSMLRHLQNTGHLHIIDHCEVKQAVWEQGGWKLKLSEGDLCCEAVWLATGSEMDASREPVFEKVIEKFPVKLTGGFPPLTADLEWSEKCSNLFVTGGYATLQMGPNALNLNGGRAAAERIVTKINSKYDDADDAHSAATNVGNYFNLLSIQ
jgi:hypothetical protein